MLAIACALLLSPSAALGHGDPFEPVHTHPGPQVEGGTGNGAVVGIGVAVLLLATAAGLIALKRVNER